MTDYQRCAAAVLTKAVLCDDLLSEVVARLITPVETSRAILRESVLPRMRDESRCDLLRQLLEHAQAPENVVHDLPSGLKELFKLRHRFAHTTPEFDDDPTRLGLHGFKNGREEPHAYPKTYIDKVETGAFRLLEWLDNIAVQLGAETRLDFSEIRQG